MRPVSRRALVLSDPVALGELFAISNLAFLAVDIFVAHSMNEFAHWAEWIPLVLSCTAPVLLVAAMIVGGNVRPPLLRDGAALATSEQLSRGIGFFVGACSIAVGIAGFLWHLHSQFFVEQTLENLVYAAPFVAPLAYSGIGLLIVLNRMVDDDTDEWPRWVILLALGGWIGNFALSLADHAQNSFFYWPEWIPIVASAMAVGALVVAFFDYRNSRYLRFCVALLLAQIGVGVAGWILHLVAIAKSPMGTFWERAVFSAPAFAPLLFADLAILATLGLATLASRARDAALHEGLATSGR